MNVLSFVGGICVLGAISLPVAAQNLTDPFGGAENPFGAPPPAGKAKQQIALDPAASAMREDAKILRAGLSPEEQIRFELNQPSSINAIEETLENVIRILSENHDIGMIVDKKALEEIGLNSDTPISISIKGVKLRNLLRLALSELDLSYTIKNEVLIVTTKDVVEKMPSVEAHTLPESLANKGDKVLAALKSSVTPNGWDSNGGPFTATTIDNVLIVSGPESVHEDVLEFVEKLNAAFERSQKAKR